MSSSKALSLYRSILRAHSKSLPPEMKSLGDTYVSSEFRLHKNVTKKEQLDNFFTEWEKYLSHIGEAARARESRDVGLSEHNSASDDASSKLYSFGSELDKSIEFNEEQATQLKNLREASEKVHGE